MRKAEREIKDFKLVEALLQRAEYVHLALWDGVSPYIVPVSFGYADKALYFHSSCKSRKADCLRLCDRVGFSAVLEYDLKRMPKACDYTAHFRSVVGTGRATLLQGREEKLRGLDIVMGHYGGPQGHYPEAVLDITCVVRVDVLEMTGKSNPPWQGDPVLEVEERGPGGGEFLDSAS